MSVPSCHVTLAKKSPSYQTTGHAEDAIVTILLAETHFPARDSNTCRTIHATSRGCPRAAPIGRGGCLLTSSLERSSAESSSLLGSTEMTGRGTRPRGFAAGLTPALSSRQSFPVPSRHGNSKSHGVEWLQGKDECDVLYVRRE